MVYGFAALFLEVESGRRPRALLKPLMSSVLYARLCEVWIRGGASGSVVRTTGARVADDAYEAVAVVCRGERIGALGLRLCRTPQGWRIMEVARPEDGPLPDPPYPLPVAEPDIFDLVLH